MINREGAFEPLVLQIGIEFCHLLGQHHALVDDAPAAQTGNIETIDARPCRGFLDPAANHVEFAFEIFLVDPLGVGNQDLFDLGPGRVGLLSQHADIHWHMPPAIDIVTHADHFGFHDGPAGFLRAKIGARQEHLAHRHQLVFFRLMPGATHLVIKERHGDLDMEARAVAGLAIGIDSPAVPDRLERADPGLDHFSVGLAIGADHQPNPAGGMLLALMIHPVPGHPIALGLFFGGPGLIQLRHVVNPSFVGGSGILPCLDRFRPLALGGHDPCMVLSTCPVF